MNDQTSILNSDLEDLSFLIGYWRIELLFTNNTDNKAIGKVKFDWFEEGAFMVIHTGAKESGMPFSICIIGKDNSQKDYTCLYIDNRKVSRIYHMSFRNNEWKQWREQPGFHQRFVGKINDAKTKITAYWEKSVDGISWEHDFNIDYIKE